MNAKTPDSEQIRLQMGELTPDEVRIAKAAWTLGHKAAIAEAAEDLRADAMRWRWFRANGETLHTAPYCYFDIGCKPEQLDAAIDAALSTVARPPTTPAGPQAMEGEQ